MAVRLAKAVWEGSLKDGKGTITLGNGSFRGTYSVQSRFEGTQGANPEELIGAAHAECFSLAFSTLLGGAGFTPVCVETTASVHIIKVGERYSIPDIGLDLEAEVPGISEDKFQDLVEAANAICPVSKALAGVNIEYTGKLVRRIHN